MHSLIFAVFLVLTLSAIAGAAAEAQIYRAPAHNYYQNNWMNR